MNSISTNSGCSDDHDEDEAESDEQAPERANGTGNESTTSTHSTATVDVEDTDIDTHRHQPLHHKVTVTRTELTEPQLQRPRLQSPLPTLAPAPAPSPFTAFTSNYLGSLSNHRPPPPAPTPKQAQILIRPLALSDVSDTKTKTRRSPPPSVPSAEPPQMLTTAGTSSEPTPPPPRKHKSGGGPGTGSSRKKCLKKYASDHEGEQRSGGSARCVGAPESDGGGSSSHNFSSSRRRLPSSPSSSPFNLAACQSKSFDDVDEAEEDAHACPSGVVYGYYGPMMGPVPRPRPRPSQAVPSRPLHPHPHPHPQRYCKSMERDLYSSSAVEGAAEAQRARMRAMSPCCGSSSNTNRHSSYHPPHVHSFTDNNAASAAAELAAFRYKQLCSLSLSRPSSPLGTLGLGLEGCVCGCSCSYGGGGGASRRNSRSSTASGLCGGFGAPEHVSSLSSHHSRPFLAGSLLGLDYEDRLLRLESDKDRLGLQVACLTDQIEVQTSKIGDLEKILDDKRGVLESTEDSLQRELLSRSSLETQKLELLTEISSLRLRQASLERENIELKDRYGLWGKGTGKPPSGGPGGSAAASSPLPSSPDYSTGAGTHTNGHAFAGNSTLSRIRLDSTGREIGGGNSNSLSALAVARSRPRTPPANAFRRVEQSAFGTLPRRTPPSSQGPQLSIFNGYGSPGGQQGQNQGQGYNYNYNYNADVAQLLQQHYNNGGGGGGIGGAGRGASLSSGNLHAVNNPNFNVNANNLGPLERDGWQRRNSGPSYISTKIVKSPPPLTLHSPNSPNNSGGGSGLGGTQQKSKSSGFLKLFGLGKQSMRKRSNSGGLEGGKEPQNGSGALVAPLERNPFVRGGMARSTAAPRLGWGMTDMATAPEFVRRPHGPATSWDSEAVIIWFNWLGLGSYSNEVGRWVKSGQQLLDATPLEVEKELGIKNSMHRKKLVLALQALRGQKGMHDSLEDLGGKLDYHWVIRWLDDIGLPQYKEAFAEARVDGRVLSALSPDDLTCHLKVTSVLHHASIKRAIQLLRLHKFHPNCLTRRGNVEFNGNCGGANGQSAGPKHVASWTNHRVMEWLRAIDLAEYAPNMRGSGVHGALIILEPRFNAELLSGLLAIPGSKTLLRRHLSLQVNELVGKRLVQEKRATELGVDFIPISPALKVKPTKPNKGFILRRKRWSSGGGATEELLCPLELNSYPFESYEAPSPFEGQGGQGSISDEFKADIIASSKPRQGQGATENDNEKVSNI